MTDLNERLRGIDQLSPPDLWEAARAKARAGVQVPDVSSRRRFALIAACLAIGGVGVAVVAFAFRSGSDTTPATHQWLRGEVESLGATFQYPSTWHLQPFEELVGRVGFTGAVVSNLDEDLHHPDLGGDGATSAWDLSNLPPAAVVVSIEHVDALGIGSSPDSEFPVALIDAKPLNPTKNSGDAQGFWLEFTLNGRLMGARVYFGPDASEEDRRIAAAVVSSIRPIEAPNSPSGSAVPTDVRDPAALPVDSFPVDGTAGSVAAADGWVWVATNDFERQGAILDRIAPSTGEVTLSLPLADSPSFLAAGAESVWVPIEPAGSGPVLLQIDATTGEVLDRFPGLFGPVVVADDGSVWALSGTEGDLEIVHLLAGSIVARIPVTTSPFDMVQAAGSVWALFMASDRQAATAANLIRIDEATGAVRARLDVQPGAIWMAGSDQGVWVSSGLSEQRGNSVLVSAADNSIVPFGDIYNFRPFAVAEGHVWFIAGPHDGPIQGACGLNLETQVADVCGQAVPDLEFARDPAAYEATTNSIWTGVYLRARVTKVSLGGQTTGA
jgi:hypothetical protein